MNLYPLSHSEYCILLEHLQYPNSLDYNLAYSAILPLDLDADRFCDAIRSSVSASDNWKTKFCIVNGKFFKTIDKSRDFSLKCINLSEKECQQYVKDFVRPFNPFEGELLRVELVKTELHYYFLFDAFHAISDGTSQTNLLRMIIGLYDGLDIQKECLSSVDHALEQEQFDRSVEHEEITQEYIKAVSDYKFSFISDNLSIGEGERFELELSLDKSEIYDCCEKRSLKVSAFLNAAYMILNSAYTGNDCIMYATVFHGRNRNTRKSYGSFIATIPIIKSICLNQTVSQFIKSVGYDLMGAMRRSKYSIYDFIKNTKSRIETIFVYQGAAILEEFSINGFNSKMCCIEKNRSASVLSIVIYENDSKFFIRTECSLSRYSKEFIIEYANNYLSCLKNMLNNIDGELSSVDILSNEKKCLLETARQGISLNKDQNSNIIEAIDSQALVTPDLPALVSENERYTYSQLVDNSKLIAYHLSKYNVSGRNVTLSISREAHAVLAMIGVMRAGATYVPIDSEYPPERIEYIKNNCNSVLDVTDELVLSWLSDKNTGYVNQTVGSTAYIIYTSGSTGVPKGVVISHRALWAFVRGIRQVLSISKEDKISCHSSFAFDASIEDIYPVLTVGGQLHIIPERLRRDASSLVAWLKENGITGGNYTTRFGMLMLSNFNLGFLRYMVLGGEKMVSLPEMNHNSVTVYNTYGPTEFTVDATWHKIDWNRAYENIPIGNAMPGQTAMIFDHHGRMLPNEVRGEICLSGDQVADGYYGDIDLPKFGKYYRTGDYGKYSRNGEIEYLGRRSQMYKINGYRIDLSEIDYALMSIEGITDCVATVNENSNAIYCYYTSGSEIDEKIIFESLRKKLPNFMIPKGICRIESMPVNVSGKIELSRLPGISVSNLIFNTKPKTRKEQIVLDIAKEIFPHTDFGVTDNLIELGFSSIQIVELVLKSNAKKISMDVTDVYQYNNIRSILNHKTEKSQIGWYGENDLSKKIMIFVSGFTTITELKPLLDRLSKTFRILLIPRLTFRKGMNLDRMVDRYIDYVQKSYVSDLTEISRVSGHSFGGELAYMVARRLQDRFGLQPELVMYDTTYDLSIDKNTLDLSMMPKNMIHYISLHDSAHNCGYSGKKILFSATERNYLYGKISNRANNVNWSKSDNSIKIINVPAGHTTILSYTLDDIQIQ